MRKLIQNIHELLRGFTFLYKIEKMYAILHLITSALSPLQPYINIFMVAKILNELAGRKNIHALIMYIAITVFANLIFSVVLEALKLLKGYHLEQFYKNEKMLFAEQSMSMDYENIENAKIHALRERIRNESQNGYNMFFLNMFSGQLIECMSSMITSIALCYNLFSDGNIMKITILLSIIFVITLNLFTTNKTNNENMKMYDSLIPFNTKFNFYENYYEDYNAGKDIRLYNLGDYVKDIQRTQNKYTVDLLIKTKKSTLKYVLLSSISSDALNILIYVFVVAACIKGSIAIGDITKYVSCIALFVSASGGLVTQFQSLFNNNKYLKSYFKYFDIPVSRSFGKVKNFDDRNSNEYIIEFIGVTFKYPNTEQYVLRNITFKIKPGERIAVVGVNGSGKTTMIKLICRLYNPTEGKILLNGIDIREYEYEHYMRLLGVVFQYFKIFSFPIGQNIAANDIPNVENVLSAAKKAGIEKLLTDIPDGINTPLYKDFDEGGIEISGGEAQKVAIARAIYKNAPIIILDEPTAALDPIAENEVYKKFNEVADNKTVIYISHRLASCIICDKILVFCEGEIVEEGNHHVLLKNRYGKYHELWNAQAQYYQ